MAAKISEQITQLRVIQVIQQGFGHERHAGGFHAFEVYKWDDDVLAVQPPKRDHAIILIGEEAGQCATVFRFNDEVLKAFPNLGVGIDHISEHGADVVALIGSQIRADAAPAIGFDGLAARGREASLWAVRKTDFAWLLDDVYVTLA